MGCLLCQTACPENAGKLRVEDSGVVFTEEETRSILDAACPGTDASLRSAAEKLSTLGLTEGARPFWRNARAAFAARGWLPPASPT